MLVLNLKERPKLHRPLDAGLLAKRKNERENIEVDPRRTMPGSIERGGVLFRLRPASIRLLITSLPSKHLSPENDGGGNYIDDDMLLMIAMMW